MLPPNGYEMSLGTEYVKKFNNNCPSKQSNFYKLMREALFNFYQITGGYHGDMFLRNMFIIHSSNKNKTVKNIKIIDYDSHINFKNNYRNKCIFQLFQQIQNEFDGSLNRLRERHNGTFSRKAGANNQSYFSNKESIAFNMNSRIMRPHTQNFIFPSKLLLENI